MRIGHILPPGLAGLKIFVTEQTDKSPPQYFAGRKNIISDIEDACSSSWERHCSGISQGGANTRLYYGAPGAGKTSTLIHLHDEWREGAYITKHSDGTKRSGPAPAMLFSGSGSIMDSLDFFCMKLVDLVNPGRGDEVFATIHETIRVCGGIDGLFVKGQTEAEKVKQLNVIKVGLEAVAKALPHSKWKRPVVIGVDETQNLLGDKHSPVGKLLQELHANNQKMPVIVVLAGLSDAVARVKELGLTRLSREHMFSLNCFDREETEELKEGFCRHFQIDLGEQESQFDQMLSATHGWPCHIQNCLYAFAKYYIEAEGDIDKVDFYLVELESLRLRTDYYYDRVSTEIRNSVNLLSSVMKNLTEAMSSWEVIDIIERQSKLAKRRTEKLPRGMTAEDYFNHLIHCGALQQSKNYGIDCPIPSFRQFLIKLPNRDKIVERHRGVFHYETPIDVELDYLSDSQSNVLH